MNTHTQISKDKKTQAAPNSTSKSKNIGDSVFALADNRTYSTVLSNNTAPIHQLKSYQAIAAFNNLRTAPVQMMTKNVMSKTASTPSVNVVQLVNRLNFTKAQRQKLLAKNRARNAGFHTCTHCGFRHGNVHYATYRGRRSGDGQFHIDHIVPASRGGRNTMRNGRVLCGTCNTSRGNRAMVGKTGIVKYRGLHGKTVSKDYTNKRR